MSDIPTAHIIVNQAYFHSFMCLGYQCVGNQTAQSILSKDIHIDMDMILRLVDIRQQCREELIAVGIGFHLVILEGQ